MKKKIIILGTSGMLGQTLFNYIKLISKNINIYGIQRGQNKYKKKNIIEIINFNSINFFKTIIKIKPDIIINCTGVINHRINNNNLLETYFINSIFPHSLAFFANKLKCKLIHISTDCVFNGNRGDYRETDIPNAYDIYGFSKTVGEPEANNTTVIRTSIIGPEKKNKLGLLEWFLGQKKISGYKNIFFQD